MNLKKGQITNMYRYMKHFQSNGKKTKKTQTENENACQTFQNIYHNLI